MSAPLRARSLLAAGIVAAAARAGDAAARRSRARSSTPACRSTHVAVVVQEAWTSAARCSPTTPDAPMNPASTMKLVTTFAALELLGPRLSLEDRGLPRRAHWSTARCTATWSSRATATPRSPSSSGRRSWPRCARRASSAISGDLVLDRSALSRRRRTIPRRSTPSRCGPTTSGPTRCSSTSSRCASRSRPTPPARRRRAVEPPLPQVALGRRRALDDGDCGNWRRALTAAFVDEPERGARRPSPGQYPRRLWRARLERRAARHPAYVHGMFAPYFARRPAARSTAACGRPRAAGAEPFADARVAAALRRRPRHQQAVEQRDGAAAVPDARHDRGSRRRRRPTVARETVRQWLARAQARIPGS